MSRIVSRPNVTRVSVGEGRRPAIDSVAAEEPLEIRVNGKRLAVTMRTPGDDFALVMGFLLSEGIITSRDDVITARYCSGGPNQDENTYNIVDVSLAAHVPPLEAALERNVLTTSACGLCGKTSIDSVRTMSSYPVDHDNLQISEKTLIELPEKLRDHQKVFDKTGGLHAAALFTPDGEMLALREDVGRHNAVDKVIGWALQEGMLPLSGHVLMVSGRSSFELTQKAIMAGIPVLSSVSAPSSLAVELANESGLTLVGFLRGETFVIYSGEQRITESELARTGEPH